MSKIEFRERMHALRVCYPHRLACDWERIVQVYYDTLHRHSREALVGAFAEGPHAHPDWFPTAGQVSRLAAIETRKLASQRAPPPAPKPEVSEDEAERNLARVRQIIESLH